jgi:glyoxylase-like metal-dependent hydrolase (beta-lactamase superfamily II)
MERSAVGYQLSAISHKPSAMNIHSLTLGFVQAYLIETPAGPVLVDCGMPGRERAILRAVEQLGCGGLRLIFITHAHADHYGSAAALARLTGAPVAIHRADAPAMAEGATPLLGNGRLMRTLTALALRLSPTPPVQAEILLDDGDSLADYGVPGAIVHTPGHTAGSCCLVLEDGTAFLGDMLAARRRPNLQHRFVEDPQALRQSYAKLRALPLARLYGGHGAHILTGVDLNRLIDAAYPG